MEEATTKRDSLDMPNGDLAVGDFFTILAWCNSLALVPEHFNIWAGGYVPESNRTDSLGRVCKVVAVDYPMICMDVMDLNGREQSRTMVRASEFECRRLDPKYAEAALSKHKPKGLKT